MSESDPLAIIGISCLFPKADDLQTYWSNIKHGVDAISSVPEGSHWNEADYFNPDPKAPDQTYARRGGFISAIDFNPMDFGIAPKDVEAIDTTQLLGMVAARQALIDAGYQTKAFARERTSVILGVTGALELVIPLGARLGHPIWRKALNEAGVGSEVAEDVVQRISDSYVGWQENSFPGLLGNVAAGRIAARLDLGGTNCVVDAACASSLAALHLAMLELQTGRSDMVITGGIDTFNDIFMYMCFSKTPALSASGNAKPFDRDCDGTILGEGLGMLVLKRLADAERDQDRIYAVIKGLGSSSDGRGNAIYAPRADGQRKALSRAYEEARVTPDTIELVEAHGTGTKVGDATEMRALTEVFRGARAEGTWAALGSVKSQIGHTKAAAGVAGLIKAALALQKKVLPPTIKVTQPIDEAAPGCSPFYVNTQKRPWLPRDSHPRRAGVSAFGFGGTNFHCVLEEHGALMDKPGWDGDVEIMAFSHDDREGLRAKVSALPADLSWAELRLSAAHSRKEFRSDAGYRLLLPIAKGTAVAAFRDAATMMLDNHPEKKNWVLPNGTAFGSGERAGKLGALFPGQGSQYVGMLRDLACQFPAMLEALSAADRVFADERPECGQKRLSDFIYPHPSFSDEGRREQEEELKATDVAQPALGAAGLGAMNVLAYFGIRPEAAAGHSYGELLALCGAGRLDAESLHQLSNARGRLMAKNNGKGDRGAMLAVQATEEALSRFVAEENSQLVIANRNSPSQFVLAGPTLEIEQAAAKLAGRSLRAKVLPVAAAFHSTLVADAQGPFADVLEKIPFRRGRIPVYANSTAKAYPGSARMAREMLAGQIVQPVDFLAQIQAMHADGVTTFVEMGPGHVLSDLVHSILHGKEIEAIALDGSKGSRSGVFDLAVTLCRIAALGHEVDLSRWEEGLEVSKEAPGAKSTFTIPLTGANRRNPQPARAPKAPIRALSEPMPVETILESHAAPNAALDTAQQGILALQKLQEQTAQLHRQFLENQDAARRTMESLLLQRRNLLALEPISKAATPSNRTFVPEPGPAPAPKPAPAPHSISSEVAQIVLAVVGEKTGYPVEMLNLEMGLDSDLGVDSIKRVEIMAALHGRLPAAPEIKPEHLGSLQTLKQVVEFLCDKSPGDRSSQGTVQHVPETSAKIAKPDPGLAYQRASSALLKVVAEKTGYPIEMLNFDMGLDSDLGVDSIKRVEIMAALRGHLPEAPEIKPEHLGSLQTLRQVVDFLTADEQGEKSLTGNGAKHVPSLPQKRPAGAAELHRQIVQPVRLEISVDAPEKRLPKGARLWIAAEGPGLGAAIKDRLVRLGYSVRLAKVAKLIQSAAQELPAGLVILWPAKGSDDETLKDAFRLIQIAGPSLRKTEGSGLLVTVSLLDGVFGFGSLNGNGDPTSGGLAGLVKTASHEWPEVSCKAIDLDAEVEPDAEMADAIVAEMFRLGPVEVGLVGANRFGLRLEKVALGQKSAKPILDSGDVVVVTGGARGITAQAVLQLAASHQLSLVLFGRSQLSDHEPAWLTGKSEEADIKKALLNHANGDRSPKKIEIAYRETMAQREIREHLRQLAAGGADAQYRTVDVRDPAKVSEAFAEIRANIGPIRGVIHGAGVLADRRIEEKTAEQFDLVYGTKVAGLKNLLLAAASDDLKVLALFSSYSGRFGRAGQADYAAANEVLNKIAQSESRKRPQCRVVSFNWGPWNGGMVSEGLRKIFEGEGVGLIEPRAGAEFFVREISARSERSVEVLALAEVAAHFVSREALADSEEAIELGVAFEREVSTKTLPCLVSHVLNGRAVMPAALMMDWLAQGALHGNPGMVFHGFKDFRVLKGLVLETNETRPVTLLAGTGEMRNGFLCVPVELASRSGTKSVRHARAEVLLAATLPAAPTVAAREDTVSDSEPLDDSFYRDGRLFHGADFYGIETVESASKTTMVARVKSAPSPKIWIQSPLRPAWQADPLVLDSSFQLMILWSWENCQAASLPCAMKSFRQFVKAYPKDGCRVRIEITLAEACVIKANFQFEDRRGNLLALAEGYECVVDKKLGEAFRQNRLPHEG